MSSKGLFFCIVMALAGSGVACAGQESLDDERVGSEAEAIEGGVSASAYREVVLLDVERQGEAILSCTGALLAPRVVLTSGRCASAWGNVRVRAPFASDQRAWGTRTAVYDYDAYDHYDHAGAPRADEHDVGLVFLDAPIYLMSYPHLASAPLAGGDRLVSVGRAVDGQLASYAAYRSEPMPAEDASSRGYRFDYAVKAVLENGDFGGPNFLADTHVIAAVSSTNVEDAALLARVDLVRWWIQEQIARYGSSDPDRDYPDYPGGGPGYPGGGPGYPGGGPGYPGGGPGYPGGGPGHPGGGPGHPGGGPGHPGGGPGHPGDGPGHPGGGPGNPGGNPCGHHHPC